MNCQYPDCPNQAVGFLVNGFSVCELHRDWPLITGSRKTAVRIRGRRVGKSLTALDVDRLVLLSDIEKSFQRIRSNVCTLGMNARVDLMRNIKERLDLVAGDSQSLVDELGEDPAVAGAGK